MAKQTFTTGQVLTAAQLTSLQQTAMGGGSATTKTASYVLVAADAGTTVAMTSTSATTITVNTGLFAAGDTVFIQNLGTGACTVTAGTATVATAGSLILPQNDAGILYFTSPSAAIFYDYIQAGAVSPLTTKGDLYTFSTSDARLGVGANGTTLVADSSEATGLKWATPAGGGKVLQVVAATDDGITTSSSTTFADTGLTVTITPTLATSKILVLANIGTLEKDQNYTNAAMKLRLVRGATSILDMGDRNLYTNAVARATMAQSIAYLDSPATTSATTYKVQFASLNATQAVLYNTYDTSNTTTSSIVVLEIGA